MIGKLLERWINHYYRKDVRNRSVMLIQGEKDDTLVKVCGTKKNLKLNLYMAMMRDEDIRDIVLQVSELYRGTDSDFIEYMKGLRAEQKKRRNKQVEV